MSAPFAIVLLGALVIAAVAAVLAVVALVFRELPTSHTVSIGGLAQEPVWEDRYRHHARQAQG